jgi:hypothetical protein
MAVWLVFTGSVNIFSHLNKSNYGCLLITLVAVLACMIMDIVPAMHRYNPISLATDNMGLIMNSIEVSSLYSAILVSCLLSLIFVSLSVTIFRRKQL